MTRVSGLDLGVDDYLLKPFVRRHIDVSIRRRDGRFVVEVSNAGALLPKGAETCVVDRFFRAAPQETEGTGLGLSIARKVAERHASGLTVENRADGIAGVVVRVSVPVTRDAGGGTGWRG